RLYRLTLLPFAIGLIIAAFSLHAAPSALPATVPPQTFDAAQASAALPGLAAAGRVPGSAADAALARRIAAHTPPYGFVSPAVTSLRLIPAGVETTAGRRTIDTVVASRGGTGPAIALIADRGDGAATATLLGLAAVYDRLLTHRALILVSTAGGAAGIAAAAAELPSGIEAAIVIGSPPSNGHRLTLLPWSTAGGVAPPALRATVAGALAQTLGAHAVAGPTLADQFTRIAMPLTTSAQG